MGDEDYLSYKSSEFQSAPTCLTDTLPLVALLSVSLPMKEFKQGPGIGTFQLRASLASPEDIAKYPAVIADTDACSLSPVLKARIEDMIRLQPDTLPLPLVMDQSILDLFTRGVYDGRLQANLSELEQLFSLADYLEMDWLTECCTNAACGHFDRCHPTAEEFRQLFGHQNDPEIQERLVRDDLPRWCQNKHSRVSLMEDLTQSVLRPDEQCLRNLLSRSPQAAHRLAQPSKRVTGPGRPVFDRMEAETGHQDIIVKEAYQIMKTDGVEETSIHHYCSLQKLASMTRNGEFTSRYVLNKFFRALSEEFAAGAGQVLD